MKAVYLIFLLKLRIVIDHDTVRTWGGGHCLAIGGAAVFLATARGQRCSGGLCLDL